jgi:hypothetical protein
MKKVIALLLALGLSSVFAADAVKVPVADAQAITEKAAPAKAEKTCHHKKAKHHKKACHHKKVDVNTEAESPAK